MGKVTTHKTKRLYAKGVFCDASFPIAHRGRGKSLSVWVRLGRANSPHAKEVLDDALSPVTHFWGGGGRGGKSLRVWLRLLPIGPIDYMPKEIHIMQMCLGSNMSVAVWCLGDICVFVAPCHVALFLVLK